MEHQLILSILVALLSLSANAESLRPKEPKGWVEMSSTDPAVLTWAKVEPTKKLADVSHFSVQQFPKSEKFEKFVKEKPLDKDSCRDLKDGGWNQTWCIRKDYVFAILSKNEGSDSKEIKEALRKWVLSYE